MPDREVYIRDVGTTVAQVLAWLWSSYSHLVQTAANDQTSIYSVDIGSISPVSVVITVGVEDGPWVAVCFGAATDVLPWANDADLARVLHAALRCEVRCCPGALGVADPQADEWLSVSQSGEKLVSWED